MISEIAIYIIFAYILPTLALVGFVYVFVKLAVLGHSLYKWVKFQMSAEERTQENERTLSSCNRSLVHTKDEIYSLTVRVHMLERELRMTNDYHRLELAEPDKGFKWFSYERGAHDDL